MRTFKEQMIETWKTFQGNWINLFLIFIINIATFILILIPFFIFDSTFEPELLIFFIIFWFLFAFCILIFNQTIFFVLASGEKKLKQAIRKAFSLFGKIFITNFLALLSILLIYLGFCFLFFLPFFFLSATMPISKGLFIMLSNVFIILITPFHCMLFPITVNEDLKTTEILKKSYILGKSNWWAIFLRVFSFILIFIVLSALTLGAINIILYPIFLPIFYTVLYKETQSV